MRIVFNQLICFLAFILTIQMSFALFDNALEKPWFCRAKDCPIYEVLEMREDYEIRIYHPSKWVSTIVETDDYLAAQMLGYYRLFRYFHGNNNKYMNISMTYPIWISSNNMEQEGDVKYKISFYLPWIFQTEEQEAPLPLDDTVFISDLPAFKVASLENFGYMTQWRLKDKTYELAAKLDRDGKSYRKDMTCSALYNYPWKIRGRYNEIWLLLDKKLSF
jgi:hypothetical protein